jgi:sterol desaturase/sphingolipid hydroxylase (fatty acid hydroxylase superfamily)
MARARDLVIGLLSPLWTPSSSAYWLYLLSALALAAFISMRGADRSIRGLGALLRALFPGRVYRHRSVRNDAGIFVANTLFYSFVLLGPVTALSGWAARGTAGVLGAAFGPARAMSDGLAGRLGLMVTLLVVADLAFFLSHYVQHRVGFLWEFHKVHHSAPVLCPLTVFRRHPVDVLFERGTSALMVGAVLGGFRHLGVTSVEPFTVMGVNAGLFLFLLLGFNLQHSHVWWSWGERLERLLVSPALHQIHHSAEPRHYDKNFGNIFSVWDGLAGTRYLPTSRERFAIGLSDGEGDDYRSLLRLYFLPFVRALGLIRRARASRRAARRTSQARSSAEPP